jgi:hypothetical protein
MTGIPEMRLRKIDKYGDIVSKLLKFRVRFFGEAVDNPTVSCLTLPSVAEKEPILWRAGK